MLCLLAYAAVNHAQTVTVDITPASARNRFIPDETLGAGVDRLATPAVEKALTKENLAKIAPSGWQPMTYRQNTELAVEAWHWNPQGTWSDARGRGYFTGSSKPGEPIRLSYGYALPRRGFTRNDGTGNTGYSRLTDGDMESFWKSNPYLTSSFTGEADDKHPQWIVIDLKHKEMLNSIRIAWGAPFATKYEVQYWTGEDPIGQQTRGVWQSFPDGEIAAGKGGTETIHLSQEPTLAQFVRVRMTDSSNTCDADGPSDKRNCVGYAIREVYLGSTTPDGAFHDMIRHTADQEQTTTYCSSIDPWHEPTDLQNKEQVQLGFDSFYTSGVTHGLPAMIPIAMIYAQPEDAAAEIQYLEARHYPISYVEMGEESDGQYMVPEDYAALYLQFAAALHRVDPSLKLGGPAFQGVNDDINVWPDEQGRTSWLGRFLAYLKDHNRMQDFAFFSFEHYPLEPCHFSWTGLYEEPQLISHIMQVWKNDGLPENLPVFITESNLSSAASEAYMDNFAGLWLADYIGSFLTAGGNGVYYFHYLPLQADRGCLNSPGTFGMFTVDKDYRIKQPLAQFFASQMINTEWVEPGKQANTIYPANSVVDDGAGHAMVTSYAVSRPDGQWAVMLVNRDQEVGHAVKIAFKDDRSGKSVAFTGKVDTVIFGKEQYAWHPALVSPMSHPESTQFQVIQTGEGHAEPDGPLKRGQVQASPQTEFQVPPASIMVIRGKIEAIP
ncbi:discoidin domain-containing protein [Silvibacterium acidisoli]|uniref:discoidin domain-containing protein n=1 Tax=Acidobacteriaceae bacterium ZG23-2 TaxID=2883246 RepID=UPI00406D30F3